jgi:hypothetical protein
VAVATAQSDATGAFPMPGNSSAKPPFQSVPVTAPGGFYDLKVTASGFNGLVIPVAANGKSLTCPALNSSSNKKNTCDNISLQHGQLTTTVTLLDSSSNPAPSANGTDILIMAEDHNNGAGLLNFEGLGMASIAAGAATSSTTMNVPGAGASPAGCDGTTPNNFCTLGPPASFDVFGQVQDSLFGSRNTATGHTIEVTAGPDGSGIPAPNVCPSPAAPASATLSGFGCAGHGSVYGFISQSDAYSTVVLSKGGVNLMQSGVAPLIAPNPGPSPNAYSFCVPGTGDEAGSGTYTLQHFEDLPNAVPSPVPGGGPVTVDVPAPVATSTAGCATICKSAQGECLFCTGTSAPSIN